MLTYFTYTRLSHQGRASRVWWRQQVLQFLRIALTGRETPFAMAPLIRRINVVTVKQTESRQQDTHYCETSAAAVHRRRPVTWNSDVQSIWSVIGPIPWGHSGPLCHALSLSSWTSMRRRRATIDIQNYTEWTSVDVSSSAIFQRRDQKWHTRNFCTTQWRWG